jgi:hypothetical protein
MHSPKIYSAGSGSAKPDVLELETGGPDISRGLDDLGETMMTEPVNWRTPLICYLENLGHVIDA